MTGTKHCGKMEKCQLQVFSPIPSMFSKGYLLRVDKSWDCVTELTITRRQILDSSKLKEFADDNFKFDENGSKLSKRVENVVGKEEIAISPFPTVFSKGLFPRGVKRCHCVGMG